MIDKLFFSASIGFKKGCALREEGNIFVVRLRIVRGLLAVVLFTGMNSLSTQFIAERLNYHVALGMPVVGQFYHPFAWWTWLFSFYEGSPETYQHAMALFAGGSATGLGVIALWKGSGKREAKPYKDLYGTAHFATFEEIQKTGLIAAQEKTGQGVYCGAYEHIAQRKTYYLRHDGPEHVCALAPTRSGKGVGLVVPTLLSWPESVFVLDRKGENYAMTAGWRGQQANNLVLRFDPAEPDVGCAWNPLEEIRFETRYQISDAQNIALMVVDSDGKGIEGDHFRTAAFELLVGLILHALYKGKTLQKTPCLQDVAHMLTGVGLFAADEPKESEKPNSDGETRALIGLFEEMKAVALGSESFDTEAELVIRGVGKRMANTPARELGSIISTVNNALSLYRDPIVGENTAKSDFKIADLMNHEKPLSLYFITTPRNADRMKPLARLLLTQIVMTLADRMEFDNGRSKTVHKHRLLLMLDEFPTLGKLDVFESALAYIAGYGMKAYLITQDVQQLYKAYGSYESIISNCHIRIAYAPNKVETAEWMSKMTGQTTIVKEQISTSGKRASAKLEQMSHSYHEVQRPLMTPDEIMRLAGAKKNAKGDIIEAGEMLIFVAGEPVIKGKQILYFLDPVFSGRSKIKPPEKRSELQREEKPQPEFMKMRFVLKETPDAKEEGEQPC